VWKITSSFPKPAVIKLVESGKTLGTLGYSLAIKCVLYNYPRKKIIKKKIQDAWGWCTGMTQRDGTGRDVIAGFRLGNMCKPMVDSC